MRFMHYFFCIYTGKDFLLEEKKEIFIKAIKTSNEWLHAKPNLG